MRFIVNSQSLLKNLQLISGIVSPNQGTPILGNFLFDVNQKTLTITGSDSETTIIIRMEMADESMGDGQITIPAKILMDSLKTFPDMPLIFDVNENYGVEITAANGKYKLIGESADAYIMIPQPMEEDVTTSIPVSVLTKGINTTGFATGNDPLRIAMTGINFELSPEGFTCVATDAHKIAKFHRKDVSAENSAHFIVPKKCSVQLKNIMSAHKSEEDLVKITYNNTYAFFTLGDTHIITRLVDGRYPNYNAIIPKNNPFKLVVDRMAFLSIVKRMLIFANQASPQLQLHIEDNGVILSTNDKATSNEAKERLSCSYEGESMTIVFNAKWLTDIVSNIDSEEVCFELSTPDKAGLIVPVYEEPNPHEDILMLVMPVAF